MLPTNMGHNTSYVSFSSGSIEQAWYRGSVMCPIVSYGFLGDASRLRRQCTCEDNNLGVSFSCYSDAMCKICTWYWAWPKCCQMDPHGAPFAKHLVFLSISLSIVLFWYYCSGYSSESCTHCTPTNNPYEFRYGLFIKFSKRSTELEYRPPCATMYQEWRGTFASLYVGSEEEVP